MMFKNVLLSLTSILIATTTIPNFKNEQLTKALINYKPIINVINVSDQRDINMVDNPYPFFDYPSTYKSENHILLHSWNHYASNWNNFLIKYPTINFINSFFLLKTLKYVQNKKTTYIDVNKKITNFQKSTNNIKYPLEFDTINIFYYLYFQKEMFITFPFKLLINMESWIKIWHHDNNIYWNYVFKVYCDFNKKYYSRGNQDTVIGNFSLKLDTVIFK